MQIFLVYLTINWNQSGYNYGLGYIASVLKEKGHNINFFTINNSSDIELLYEQIKLKEPDIIGFYVSTYQFIYLKEIIPKIKKISKSFVIIGGPYPTLKPECIYEIPELDAIVRGEGEFPMLDLVEAFEHKTDHLLIKNFWYKTKEGVVKNDLRPLINDLDKLPLPDKSPLDYQQEINRHGGINRFIFSRGCIFECTYCSNKAYTDLYNKTYYRVLSPQRAIEGIESDASKYKFKEIIFDDDTINLNEEWFLEFFALYKKEFTYPFICNMRPDIVNPVAIKLLKDAGVKGIWIGVEHGNEEFRRTVLKRNIKNEEIINAFNLIAKNNIKCYAQIMVGLPFENKELFLDTVKLCRKLPIRSTNSISIFNPYPSTELGKICEQNNWLPSRGKYHERSEAAISYPGFSKEEIQLCADVFPSLMRFKFIPLNIPLNIVYYTLVFPRKLIHRLFGKTQ
ncbi:anaerobic magnesium-protoporphyrin IX monomethyl ester cyclase [Methanosarcinales archaeon]|nr:anaerobic magnesium-protoporphyrin IX monomethyl ester cyclase [Methanosarcinales archaeon]